MSVTDLTWTPGPPPLDRKGLHIIELDLRKLLCRVRGPGVVYIDGMPTGPLDFHYREAGRACRHFTIPD